MVKKLEEAVIARLRKGDHNFEIFVDLEKALKFREKKLSNISEVIVYEEVFKDAKKGERVSFETLKKVFGTDDILKVSEIIVLEGEIQITTEYRRKLINEKRKEIIEIIHRNAVDPRTKLPHPPQRIEMAIEKAGVKIDPFKPAEQQVDDVIKKIKYILPLKFEKVKIAARIHPEIVGKSIGQIQRNFRILQEEWANDGSWIILIEVPMAQKERTIELLNNYTEGKVDIKILEK